MAAHASRGRAAAAAGLALLLAGCLAPPPAGGEEGVELAELPTAPEVPALSALALYTGAVAFEPTIGATPDGVLYVSSLAKSLRAPDPSLRLLSRSRDGGLSWEDATPRVGGAAFPPTSGDPYVHVDRATGRVFVSDLQVLVCSTLSFSDDGQAWTHNPLGCGHPVGAQDHQTIFTSKPRLLPTLGYPNLVHYCVNRLADTACAASADGGLTFGALRPLVYQGVSPSGFCSGLSGHGVASPEGILYLPRAHCGVPSVAISEDDGLTWTVVAIDKERVTGHHLNGIRDDEVSIGVADDGSVHALWIAKDRKPYLASSFDGGRTWTPAVNVAPPDVGTAAFPALAAGFGTIAAVYYGTAADKEYGAMNDEDAWHVYLARIEAEPGGVARVETMRANDPSDPMARGVCGGSRCAARERSGPIAGFDGAVGDFIDIAIGPDGRPWAAVVDVCTGPCASGQAQNNDAQGVVATWLATG